MNCVAPRSRQLTMLDSRFVGANEVAPPHQRCDFLISAFAFAVADAVAAAASAFASASEAFEVFVLGIFAAALSSSSMTIQPLEVERQRRRPIQIRSLIHLLSPDWQNCLNSTGDAGSRQPDFLGGLL